MDDITTIIIFFIGLIIGLTIACVYFKRTYRHDVTTIIAHDPEYIELATNLKAKDEQVLSLKNEYQILHEEFKNQGNLLIAEAVKKSAAEAINSSIPQLNLNLAEKEKVIRSLQDENSFLKTEISRIKATADEKDKSTTEKLAILDDAQLKLSDAFKALSAEALKSNNQAFLELANETHTRLQEAAKTELEQRQVAIEAMVKPMKESLEKVDTKLQEVEKARIEQFATLSNEAKSLSEANVSLQAETAKLVNALRAPSVRGRWGEITLRRVVELAGMVDHCDFNEQTQVDTEEGRLRPDMTVNLPNERCIVVDSKAPLSAYIEALEATDDEERKRKLQQHAQQVRTHIIGLGNKEYWAQFDNTPEFVILFIPGESFLSAAVDKDPDLIEFGSSKNIVLATPLTLIALMKTIHQGWRHEKIAENAQEISNLGKDLYERISKFTCHLEDVGKHLDRSVDSYNKAVGTFEGRVLVSTRKFKQLGATTENEIGIMEPIDKVPRRLRSYSLDESSKD
jgi:DNA recombination protein RmuC